MNKFVLRSFDYVYVYYAIRKDCYLIKILLLDLYKFTKIKYHEIQLNLLYKLYDAITIYLFSVNNGINIHVNVRWYVNYKSITYIFLKYHFSKQHQFNPKYSIIIINTIKISIISVIFRDAWCHPRPMNETKISNAATGQAKLFLCALALLTRGRKPDSPGKIYNSTSNPEERIKTTQFMCNIIQKTSLESVTKEKTNRWLLGSFQVGNTNLK